MGGGVIEIALLIFQAWQNERFAPELLEHKTEVVDCILEQIKEMVRLHDTVSHCMMS